MMSHAVVCLALLSVATVSAQYPTVSSYGTYPTSAYTSYPVTSSASLFTDALYSSYGTSSYSTYPTSSYTYLPTQAELYNPFIPVGGAAFGIAPAVVLSSCEKVVGVHVQAFWDGEWYGATIDAVNNNAGTYSVVWDDVWDDGTGSSVITDEDDIACDIEEEHVCVVNEKLDITNFDTGVDVSRTIKYQRTLTCECDGNQNPIAETCFRPSDMPATCNLALYPCDVALEWELDGVNFAGEKFDFYMFKITKNLECQCNVAGEPDFPTCIDLEAQAAWEEAQLEYETAYAVYLVDQAAAVAEYESEAALQAAAYEEYIASLASGTELQATAYEEYIASLEEGSEATEEVPIIDAPTEEVPIIDAPTEEVPIIDAPTEEVPIIDAPTEEVLIIDAPTDAPGPGR